MRAHLCSGVSLSMVVVALGLLPLASRIWHRSSLPLATAKCSGVLPR
jgi:hypothetical protein